MKMFFLNFLTDGGTGIFTIIGAGLNTYTGGASTGLCKTTG